MKTNVYPGSVFDPQNAINKPEGSRFFVGETVLHTGNNQLYTVCDLSNCLDDHYGLWPEGQQAAVPTHGSYGLFLKSVSEPVNGSLIETRAN